MRKFITEFIGTFFLVLTVGMVATAGKGDFSPIAISSVLMCMVFAGANISGAHYNPAITLAVLLRNKISIKESVLYVVAQILAAVVASYMVKFLAADKIPQEAATIQNITAALMSELLGTFALVYVVLNVFIEKGLIGSVLYGLTVGLIVLSMTYAFGGISGGVFNPAVAIGMSMMRFFSWNSIWIFLFGNFGAATLAAIVFRINNSADQ